MWDHINQVRKALDYVKSINEDTCVEGTGNTLGLEFDHDPWIRLTDPAIRTANLLSKILAVDGNLDRLEEDTFYSLVRNNVHGEDLIYGSAIAVEVGVLTSKNKFCPYAYRNKQKKIVAAFDLATSYDYRTNETAWYNAILIKDFSNITLSTDEVIINESTPTYITQPVASYANGDWTFPYYDCGGGNIWMTTYSSPIMALDSNGNTTFMGVATIDIELTNLDINQCDRSDSEDKQALDIFRGTHNCQPTTRCVALNEGFKAGAYTCECENGYYFPNFTAEVRAYSGKDIEDYFYSTNSTDVATQYQCLKCPRGCDTCTDATPCLYQINEAVQVLILIIMGVMVVCCILVAISILRNKKHLVIKTASPIFLLLMCVGAILMCSSVFVMYGEVTSLACTIQIWPFHLGFAIMYGALLVKTWRISVIFKSKGRTKRVNLPDKALLQRMIPLVAVVASYLGVWTAIQPPKAETLKTSGDLKFFVCEMSYWTYAIYACEAMMLLVGVYLCFTVRKVPAHFNESKFITWATYNAIILGSFVLMLTKFVGMSVGPDVVFVLTMAQQQVFVTITMGLIFTPKFWALYKGTSGGGRSYANQVTTITGRVKTNLAPTSSRFDDSSAVATKSISVQCNPEDFYLISGGQDDDHATSKNSGGRSILKHTAKISPLTQNTLAPPEPNGTAGTWSSNA